MAPGRFRRFFSQSISRLGRVFRRRRSSEQDRGRIQQCSDHDDAHSSEMLWHSQVSSHEIILTQDFTQIQPGETPVASPLGPCEEVGDGCPSLLVHGDGNSNYLKTSHNEVLGIKPPCVQNFGGPIVTSSAVQETCSEDEDGYLGDGDSSKGSVTSSVESCSKDEDGYLGDGDSSDLNDLEERMPPVGEDQPPPPFPLKETSLPLKQRDDYLHHPQIPEQFPMMMKRLSPEGQLSHNLQDYSNLSSLQHHLESGKSLHHDKKLLPKHHNIHEPAVDSSSITSPPNFSPREKSKRPSRKRKYRLACSPPENRSERRSHEQRRQLSRSESEKLRSTKWGKKRRLQRKKKKKLWRGRKAINLGNSPGKGKAPSFTSKPHEQSDVQSHTTKGCSKACISHVTRRNKPSQPGDSSSSSSDNMKSSESESESSGSSSDGKNRRSKRTRARKRKQQSPGNHREEKEKSSDSESSGEFETAPEDEEGTANKNKGSQDPNPKDVFVAGSDKEQHLESREKSPDRKSLDSFTNEATISKQPPSQILHRPKSSTPAQLDNLHPTKRMQLSGVIAEELDETQQASTESTATQVPSAEATPQVVFDQSNLALIRPEVGAFPQPDSAAENKQKSFKDDAIGGSSKTKSASQASQSKPLCVGGSDFSPVPFPWQAEEKHTTQPQLIPSRALTPMTCELRAELACSAIMPIRVQCGRPPCTLDLSVEEVLELCAVGDLTLLLNAVKVLGTILYCKQSFTQCGQPLASIIPGVMVDCQDEHEWVLIIDINVTACDTETVGSFMMDIFRLISNLLEKWQAFHSPEKHQPQLISLLKCLCNAIEESCLSDFDEMGADRLLNYLVKLLAPFCEH